MNRIIVMSAAALAFAAPAAAFDNASCKEFLTGTWTLDVNITLEGKPARVASKSDYRADGSFDQAMTLTTDGVTQPTMTRKGTWDAGPGDTPDTCKASVTPEGEAQEAIVLTVIDANSVKTPDGNVSMRATN